MKYQKIICLRVHLAVIILRVHDNDEMCRNIEAPGQVPSHDQHLDSPAAEQMFCDLLLLLTEALVEVAHAVGQRLLQCLQRHEPMFSVKGKKYLQFNFFYRKMPIKY